MQSNKNQIKCKTVLQATELKDCGFRPSVLILIAETPSYRTVDPPVFGHWAEKSTADGRQRALLRDQSCEDTNLLSVKLTNHETPPEGHQKDPHLGGKSLENTQKVKIRWNKIK